MPPLGFGRISGSKRGQIVRFSRIVYGETVHAKMARVQMENLHPELEHLFEKRVPERFKK